MNKSICNGCDAGYTVGKDGIHRNPAGQAVMYCLHDKYIAHMHTPVGMLPDPEQLGGEIPILHFF